MKTNIFYVHLLNDYSGSPRVLCDAINSSTASKDNSFVLTSQHEGFLNSANANIISFHYRRADHKLVILFFFLIAQVQLFMKLSKLLLNKKRKENKNLVIVNTMLPFGAALAARLFSAELIYYVHETKIEPKLLKRFLRFFIEFFAHHVIFVSDYLKRKEKFQKPNQVVLHNGLRSDFTVSSLIDRELKYERKQIFFAGSLKTYKGIQELIKLAELLPNRFVAALNCEEHELDFFLKNNEIPSNLVILRRPSNIQEIYEDSFVVLNLSIPDLWVETFGLSLLEGMAFGCVVVAPPLGGPTEFVNNTNGRLILSSESEKISNFIIQLNSSYELWSNMSVSAEKTANKFSTSEFQKNFKCLIESIQEKS